MNVLLFDLLCGYVGIHQTDRQHRLCNIEMHSAQRWSFNLWREWQPKQVSVCPYLPLWVDRIAIQWLPQEMILMRIYLRIVSDSSYAYPHTLPITCTCCYDKIKGTQDYCKISHAHSLWLSLWAHMCVPVCSHVVYQRAVCACVCV